MQTPITEFDVLHEQVLGIDPSAPGSLGRIARVKAQVNQSFLEDRIPPRHREILIEELKMIQRRALHSVKL